MQQVVSQGLLEPKLQRIAFDRVLDDSPVIHLFRFVKVGARNFKIICPFRIGNYALDLVNPV